MIRVVAISYFIYKMAFSDPNLNWDQLFEIENSSPGVMTGDILVKVVFGLIFIMYIGYQVMQAISEYRQKESKKNPLRLVSIIWSILFYPIVLASLFNVNLEIDNTSIGEYLIEFYTVSTILGVAAAIITLIMDIKILKLIKEKKNPPDLNSKPGNLKALNTLI